MVKNMFLQLLKKNNITYGSCDLNYTKDNGRYKKKPIFSNGHDSPYDAKKNGVFIKTGEPSGLVVLDLDNMENDKCKQLQVLAMQTCNLVIKTRKGYHYYFKLDTDLKQRKLMKQFDFDYLANGGIVFCPPSQYKDEHNKQIEYKVLQTPSDDEEINSMSEALVAQLKELFTGNKPKAKDIEKCQKKEIKETEKAKVIVNKISDEKMKLLLSNLHPKRVNDYMYWILCGLALKGCGYPFDLWDEWSKTSEKYTDGECYYLWTYNLKPTAITTGTLFYWLRQDNQIKYNELFKSETIRNYDGDIDLKNETQYDCRKMHKYLQEDIKSIGVDDYIDNIHNTKSFKYFNYFHLHQSHIDMYYVIEKQGKRSYLSVIANMFNYTATLKVGEKLFFKHWNESIYKNQYNKVDFLPNKNTVCPKDVYNQFTGFVFDKEDKTVNMKLVQPLLDHILYIVNGKQDVYEYIIKWMAYIRQYPHKKTLVAIVLYSKLEGIGKNIFVDMLARVLDGYYVKIKEEDLVAKFNSDQENKLFIFGDEIKGSNRDSADDLKDLITRTRIKIEPKGKNKYTVSDYANYIFTTNNNQVFKVTLNDRRYVLVPCTDKLKSRAYYINLSNILEDDDVIQEFDNYLSSLDLSEYIPQEIPMTEYKKEVILYNLPAYIKMVRDKPEEFTKTKWKTNDLYVLSLQYAKENRKSQAYSKEEFQKDFKSYFSIYYSEKLKNDPKDKQEKYFRGYLFPDDLADIIDDHLHQVCFNKKKQVDIEEVNSEPKVVKKGNNVIDYDD